MRARRRSSSNSTSNLNIFAALSPRIFARAVAETTHLALDCFRRMRPGSFGVRIVIRPHEVVDKVPFLRKLQYRAIFLKCRSAVAAEIFAGQALELWIRP